MSLSPRKPPSFETESSRQTPPSNQQASSGLVFLFETDRIGPKARRKKTTVAELLLRSAIRAIWETHPNALVLISYAPDIDKWHRCLLGITSSGSVDWLAVQQFVSRQPGFLTCDRGFITAQSRRLIALWTPPCTMTVCRDRVNDDADGWVARTPARAKRRHGWFQVGGRIYRYVNRYSKSERRIREKKLEGVVES